jgi:NAD dependent epimerase/dehydratase family enzyme
VRHDFSSPEMDEEMANYAKVHPVWSGGMQGAQHANFAIRFLLENQNASGPFNLTSPQLISSAEFLRAAAKQLHRPYWLPVPGFVLRLVLGPMATLVLDGAYLLPRRLQELGFGFRFVTVETALRDLLGD